MLTANAWLPIRRFPIFHHIRSLTCWTVKRLYDHHRRSLPGLDVHDTASPLICLYQGGLSKSTNLGHYPHDAQVVDATGTFVIPGLWDMHVHWYLKDYLPLFIANGVTGVRLMWGRPMHHAWRKEIEQGTLLGPRLVIASPIVDGLNPIWRGSIAVGNAAEAREEYVNLYRWRLERVLGYRITHSPPSVAP